MKKTILALFCILQSSINFANLPAHNQLPGNTPLNNAAKNATKGLVGDLQAAVNNFPQTVSSMLPTVNSIQKLLLSAAVIGLGYQCCKYGLSKYNKATKLYSISDDSEKGKRKYAQSKWFAFTGSGFLLAGTCMLLGAQRLANFAYGQ